MKVNNRDKIFDVSVDLFSKYGYDAVSIRRIAREVGIKESSIYHHYKCKESILDAILEYYISKMTSDEIPLSKAAENLDVGIDFFYNTGLELYKSKLCEPQMMKITRIILVEAYHNEKIRDFVKNAMIAGPINGWMDLFDLMKMKGLIRKDSDSRHLAESFYYYGLFLMIEHFIVNYPEDDGVFLERLGEKSQLQMELIFNSVREIK